MNVFRRRLITLLFRGLPLLLAMRVQADFYLSPTGKDQGAGTLESPFGTLERARDAIRELKRKGTFPGRGLRVWLRGGDYIRTNSFELTAQDSGTEQAPIGWHPFFNEPVRFLGGRILSASKPVTNAAVFARLDPAARERVRQIDLRALGILNFGEMKSRGFARPTTPAHEELFYAGRPMTLARWPNEGSWEKIAGIPDTTTKGDEHGGKLGDLPGGFFYAGERPKRWQDVTDVWVHGYWAWDWANSYERVAELDRDRHFLRTAPPYGLYGFRAGQRFQFLNILEELDQPGEWYLDRPHGLLYFWPPDAPSSKSGAEPETLLSLLAEPFLRLSDTSHLTFRGFTFEATRSSAVEIHGGTSNRLVDCHLRNLGNAGVIVSGGTGHGMIRCDFFDTGDGGVTLSGGDRQTLTPGGHYVENCHFQRQGRWSKCYVPAIQLDGVGQRASHNLIHDHPHAAILFNGNDHLIEFNDIHHIALESGDVGAVYTGRDYSYRGNRIRYNFIHETGGVGMGSMGVYMDDCVSGTEVFGNIFYRVHWAMFIGGGRDHRVENNLFVECDPGVRADGRGLDTSPVWRDMVNVYMRKQLAAVPAALYRERYPALRTLDEFYGPPEGPVIEGAQFRGVPPGGNVIARNVAIGKWLELGWHAQSNLFDVHDNLVATNALPADPGPNRFDLPADSPAWKLGFQQIPFGEIGPRQNTERHSTPEPRRRSK